MWDTELLLLLVFFWTPRISPSVIMKIFAAIGLICALSLSDALNVESEKRILEGTQAERNQFPYMVAIHTDDEPRGFFLCAGAILAPRWVVTARDCWPREEPLKVMVIAGKLHATDYHKDVQTVSVAKIVIADHKLPFVGMAILKLAAPLTFNDAVKPLALPEKDKEYSGDAVLAGWGLVSMDPILRATTLHYIEMPIITNEECNNLLAEHPDSVFLVKKEMLCTLPSAEQSACFLDYGGPLVQDGVLVGILSYTRCSPGSPDVFTKASAYLSLLEKTQDH